MKARFEVVPYRLRTQNPLNARTARCVYAGALVRAEGGYGCVHPWPELGDAALPAQLRALASGEDTPLTGATRRCLALDREARHSGRSLFSEQAPPPLSHATVTDLRLASLQSAAERGFAAAKVKASGARLAELASLLERSPLPLRLDFNETLTCQALCHWAEGLHPDAQAKIDLVEDPCPYDPQSWITLAKHTGWRLAVDRSAPRATEGFHVLVIKPAVTPIEAFLPWLESANGTVLVTTYMEHPLGQLYAAHEAARLAARFAHLTVLGGLTTHQLFESLPAALDLGNGPALTLPGGTGLGLDHYLQSLPWKPLEI